MEKSYNPSKAWFVAILTILYGITFAMTFLKIPPTMTLLIEHFGISLTASGLLMTIPSFAILFSTVPAGILCSKIGSKNTMLVVLGVALIGNILGYISNSYSALLVARFFDGFAVGMATVAIPPVISMWFPAQKRGLPLALFSIWVPIAMFILFRAAAPIVAMSSWKGVWVFVSILSIILAVVFTLFVRTPKEGEGAGEQDFGTETKGKKGSVIDGFKLPIAWILGFIDLIYTIVFAIFNNYFATYLQMGAGLDMATANNLMSYSSPGAMIGGLCAGIVMNTVNKKKHAILFVVTLIPVGLISGLLFQTASPGLIIVAVAVLGFVCQFVPPLCFTIGSNMAPRLEDVGSVMAVITVGQSLGGIVAPMMVGPIVGSGNWGTLTWPIFGVTILAVLMAIYLVFYSAKKYNKLEAGQSQAAK